MKDIFYKTFKWILLTVGASVITIFVQGVLNGPQDNTFTASAGTSGEYLHFSYEKITEDISNDTYQTDYLLRLIGSTSTVADQILFVYPGEYCTEPKLVIGTGDIAAPHYAYEWRYTSTCQTQRALQGDEIIFSVI